MLCCGQEDHNVRRCTVSTEGDQVQAKGKKRRVPIAPTAPASQRPYFQPARCFMDGDANVTEMHDSVLSYSPKSREKMGPIPKGRFWNPEMANRSAIEQRLKRQRLLRERLLRERLLRDEAQVKTSAPPCHEFNDVDGEKL